MLESRDRFLQSILLNNTPYLDACREVSKENINQ